jgi:hypothetical protein
MQGTTPLVTGFDHLQLESILHLILDYGPDDIGLELLQPMSLERVTFVVTLRSKVGFVRYGTRVVCSGHCLSHRKDIAVMLAYNLSRAGKSLRYAEQSDTCANSISSQLQLGTTSSFRCNSGEKKRMTQVLDTITSPRQVYEVDSSWYMYSQRRHEISMFDEVLKKEQVCLE